MPDETTTPAPAAKKPRPHQMTDVQKSDLWDYLVSIRNRIEPEKLYPSKLAEMAAEQLKMPFLTKHHVRQALEVKRLPVVRSPRTGTSRGVLRQKYDALLAEQAVRIDQLEHGLAFLRQELTALQKLVEETADALGKGQRFSIVNGQVQRTGHQPPNPPPPRR